MQEGLESEIEVTILKFEKDVLRIHNSIYSDVINYSWPFLILFILRRRKV